MSDWLPTTLPWIGVTTLMRCQIAFALKEANRYFWEDLEFVPMLAYE
jgi:hypothetical protein